MKVHLTRDSVAMGDDVGAPHDDERDFPAGMHLREAVTSVARSSYLPRIGWNRATWVLTSGATPLAVVAQQWTMPRLLTSGDPTLAALATDGGVVQWHFQYLRQQDPVAVYERLRAAPA